MRIEFIRCDFCNMELYYQDSIRENKFRTIISVPQLKVDNIETYLGNEFCSPECVMNALKEKVAGEPLKEDVLKSLAESLGYEIIRKPKKVKNNQGRDIIEVQ